MLNSLRLLSINFLNLSSVYPLYLLKVLYEPTVLCGPLLSSSNQLIKKQYAYNTYSTL